MNAGVESNDSGLVRVIHSGYESIQGLGTAAVSPGWQDGPSSRGGRRGGWPAQSTRGMTVKGTAGLLASSSKAVRKHSVAAASLP